MGGITFRMFWKMFFVKIRKYVPTGVFISMY